MNRLLRALWDRLLPPGGDVAVADDRELFMPGGRPLRVCWLGYRPEPWRLDDEQPQLDDLSPCDLELCWCWDVPEMSWKLATRGYLSPGDRWLPYRAIADPSAGHDHASNRSEPPHDPPHPPEQPLPAHRPRRPGSRDLHP